MESKWSDVFSPNVRLKKIKYLAQEQGQLVAIQLMFSNGVWTSALSTPKLHGVLLSDMKTVDIPPNKSVRQICVKTWATSIDGLTLIDDEGKILLDIEWCSDKRRGKWITQNVPIGEEIVGIKTDTYFNRIGFICYKKRKC